MIKAIIFDFDQTLVNTLPIHYQAYNKVSNDIGISLTMDHFYKNIGGIALEVIPKFINGQKCPISIEEIHKRKKKEIINIIATCKIEPLETHKLLDIFKINFKIALASCGSNAHVKTILNKLHWNDYFDVILTAENITYGKPNPEIFEMAAQKLNVSPKECLVFEDSDDGILAAQNAGMRWFNVNNTTKR